MKIAVLTSSIGSTKLLEPKPFNGVDYHAFVDYEDDNTSWIKHPIIPFSSDVRYKNRRDAKVYKVLPFAFLPNYDYYFCCLLYTSPSPRDWTISRMPSSA